MLASTPLMVVRIGSAPLDSGAAILTSSFWMLPLGVLMMMMLSFFIMSMTCGRPSFNLKERCTVKPAAADAAAVPLVASMVNPRSTSLFPKFHDISLSASLTLRKRCLR